MSKKRSPNSVIDLTGDDSDDDERKQDLGDVRKNLACASYSKKKKAKVRSGECKLDLNVDGLEIIEPSPPPIIPPAAQMPSISEDEVEMVGSRNKTRLPHLRQDCTQFKFDSSFFNFEGNYSCETLQQNRQSCDLCYCYVCDCPAKECKSWHSNSSSQGHFNHCCGNNAVAFWKTQWSISKATGSASLPSASVPGSPLDGTGDLAPPPSARTGTQAVPAPAVLLRAKLSTGNQHVPQTTAQTRDVSHHQAKVIKPTRTRMRVMRPTMRPAPAREVKPYTRNQAIPPCEHVLSGDYRFGNNYCSCLDFCRRCGRVARMEDFGKDQATPIKKDEEGLFLGFREVKFTISLMDIRNVEDYRDFWAVNANKFSEVEMEDEFFRYLGPNPRPNRVAGMLKLASAASCNDKLDKNNPLEKDDELSMSVDVDDESEGDESVGNNESGDDELEGNMIVVQTEQDGDLIRCAASCSDTACEINASWDKSTRQGTLRIGIHLKGSAFFYSTSSNELRILMGLWYGIFPLNVADLALPSVDLSPLDSFINDTDPEDGDYLSAESKEKLLSIAKACGQASGARKEQLKLLGSTGDVHQGFICPQYSASFSDLFCRFYSAKVSSWGGSSFPNEPYMKLRSFEQEGYFSKRLDEEKASLGTVPSCFVNFCLKSDRERYELSIQESMERMENLGHEDYGYLDGLNVELLEFQRQTLQWALERETMEGGIQMWFWGKLPDDSTRKDGNDVYFNPLLGHFRRGPPELVRGGFIAEEMGLGKTVISLALILENPAPEEPASGSHITDLDKLTISTPWTRLFIKRRRVRTRSEAVSYLGCPVSLVGQWVEEAKTKLKDPGLIYPYYGGSRKRDASILARNSIVVTTYQVLASDATYHAKKGGQDYCAPLEQVRWWRMICDEGHVLRDGSTVMSRAVSSLVADHKWLVSGTPLNTGFRDLTNQFKILGIEHADKLVRKIVGGEHVRKYSNYSVLLVEQPLPSLVPFLLGSVMIRHSQKQKYRGTETTLMSLPKKTERTISIKFSDAEKAEYDRVETSVRDFYVSVCKNNDAGCIGRNYLKLSQELMPLRVACSGGNHPLDPSFEFTSKLKTLIKELERARDSDATSKSLVFSQFSTTLQWLQEELPKHGFQYRTLKGDMSMQQRAKALHDFQSDPPTTVFLLSMRAGAVGINLTQANRVFLMEPCLNPALEKQAIGRVHRLGQKREVEIIRLIQEDSIETRLLKFLKRKYGSSGSEESDGVAASVGPASNLMSDKVQMMTDDFNLLFGVEGIVHGNNDDAVADMVPSYRDDGVADMVPSYRDDGVADMVSSYRDDGVADMVPSYRDDGTI